MTQFLKCINTLRAFRAYRRHRKPNADVLIDISNVCNASCYYCPIGRANREHAAPVAPAFMDPAVFEKVLRYLKEEGFLGAYTCLLLYIWHEPLLHPEFAKIVEIATRERCFLDISTNGSVVPKMPNHWDASRIVVMWFSMCGFSQASYDKIHAFDFERVKRNIEALVKMFRSHGCCAHFKVAFHVYQFNVHELPAAYEWARSLHIDLQTYFASTINFEDRVRFLRETLPMDYLTKIATDLFMGFNVPRKAESDCYWFHQSIAVNAAAEVLPCCNITGPTLGSVFEMHRENLCERHEAVAFCKTCKALGLTNGDNAYCDWFPPPYSWRTLWWWEVLKTCLRP